MTTETQQTPQFSVNDLFVVRSIIDVCSKRGAFQANELKTVGELYEKLDAFLKEIEAKAAEENAAKEGEESEAAEEAAAETE
jgi:hypothetical protein